MGFPDFEIGANKDSYISSKDICLFLNRYADHFELRKYINFQSYVLRVLKKKDKWQVSRIDNLNQFRLIFYTCSQTKCIIKDYNLIYFN